MSQSRPSRFQDLGKGPVVRGWYHVARFDARFGLVDLAASLFIAFTLLLMLGQADGGVSLGTPLKEGEVADRTVRIWRSVEIEDKEATRAERAQAIARVPEVYDYDSQAVKVWIQRWRSGVQAMRNIRGHESMAVDPTSLLSEKLGVAVTRPEYDALVSVGFTAFLERSVIQSLGTLWDAKIVENRTGFDRPVEVVDLKTGTATDLKPVEAAALKTVDEAVAEARAAVTEGLMTKSTSRASRAAAARSAQSTWSRWPENARQAVFGIQARMVRANLTLNRKETETRREAAVKDIRPFVNKLERGEVLVRQGERASHRAAQFMTELAKRGGTSERPSRLWSETLFGGVMLWLLLQFLRRQFPLACGSRKDGFVAAALLLVSLACFKLTLLFQLEVLGEFFSNVPAAFFLFMVPAATSAMIVRLLMRPGMTLLFSALLAVGTVMLLDKAALFSVHVFVSCLAGAAFLSGGRTRASLYIGGLRTAFICGCTAVLTVYAWGGQVPLPLDSATLPGVQVYPWAFFGGAVGGWLASALTLVFTPILENLLEYTTELRLLELARMDHPLLRELVLKAPGTYHHSIIVGSLVEAGCEAIGANALLARVGSYYHDVGKIGRAEYFVENQNAHNNPHDNMKPTMSARIIISHVKEGVVLARQHKMGQGIIDFIEQHHGNSLVGYFYNKARQECAQPGSSMSPDQVREEDFRYPGPKPQSKEAAIMALADSCEAATRSLVDPTPARIEGMVMKIVQKGFSEGLLDEADITMREVHLVAQAFVRILLGIHHNRIQYPDQEKGLPTAGLKAAGGGGRS